MSELSLQSSAPRKLANLAQALRLSLKDHGWLLACSTIYIVVALAVLDFGGHPYDVALFYYVLNAAIPPIVAVGLIVFGHVIYHGIHVRTLRLRDLINAIKNEELLSWERAIYALVPILIIPIFSSTFTSFKDAIPLITPFHYDALFSEIDRWLHFGIDPWRLLQPILGVPLITSAISFLYNMWLPLMMLVLWWQIFSLKNRSARMQYLLSFILVWSLLGSTLALVFSSAGPVYYGNFVAGENPYAPLMDYLRQANTEFTVWSLTAQDYLWENYQTSGIATGGGIAAMPSLHVGVATLQALLGWRVSKKLGILLTAYLGVILIGSVHLGWHYAIDGYLSIVLTITIWTLAGKLLRYQSMFRAREKSPDII